MECLYHILNLRFLSQELKSVTTDFTNVWKFITKHIDIPTECNTAGGPTTICPICTIPVIGALNYLKQNLKNITNATMVAARNFNTRQLTTITLSKTLKLVKSTAVLLMIPLGRMRLGRFTRRNMHRKKPQNQIQNQRTWDSTTGTTTRRNGAQTTKKKTASQPQQRTQTQTAAGTRNRWKNTRKE